MMKKRLLCALLLLALLAALLPTMALADNTAEAGSAQELKNLLDKKAPHITLTGDITLGKNETLTIPYYTNKVTIDMAGHTISGGNLVVHNRKETNLTGGGTIDCCLAELNGTISGDAKFLKKVMLVPDDGCHIYGGSFYGKITTRSSTDAVEFNGGTFYNTVNTAGCNSVTVYGGVFHEDAKFLCGAGQSNVFGGVFYKNVQAAGSNGSTNNIWAGMFFDTSVASQFAEGTVSMNVIFHANGGIFNANGSTSETVTAKAVANRTPEYSALIAPPKPLPTKDGYVLTGWYTDSVGGTSFMFDQKWNVDMIKVQQNQTITLYARWEEAPEEPEEPDSFPALAAGALLLAGDDNPFRDVRAIDWFYDDVMYAYDRGLITGTAYGKFSPRDSFTRGMLLTILARHDGVNTKGTPWYQAGCDWAAKNGISDGENPEEAISREEFALILYRYAQYLGKQTIERADLSRYTDAGAVSETALPAVQWAAAEAILRGDNFRLNPQDGATRAEAAAMLHRFFTR